MREKKEKKRKKKPQKWTDHCHGRVAGVGMRVSPLGKLTYVM